MGSDSLYKLVSTDYCGYAAEGEFVYYSPLNKQTLLLPGYTGLLLERLTLCFPAGMPIFAPEQLDAFKTSTEHLKKTVTFLLQHNVIEEKE